jgi:hypothetical protein
MSQGIQYIHFLKSPPSNVAINQSFKVVLDITNDLTDEKSYEETALELRVYDSHGQVFDGIRLKSGDSTVRYTPFNGGYCSFEAAFTRLPPCGTQTVQLAAHAAQADTIKDVDLLKATIQSDCLIVPVWTTDIHVTKSPKQSSTIENQYQCERQLHMKDGQVVRILEDKEESIARHLWYSVWSFKMVLGPSKTNFFRVFCRDSGLAMCCFMTSLLNGNSVGININPSSVVLELGRFPSHALLFLYPSVILLNEQTGSGTGAAGIFVAKQFSPQKMILTDLADAVELLNSNAQLNSPCSDIEVQELDWYKCASIRSQFPEKVDIILLSDVLYNQDTHDGLLDALDSLADQHTQVLLAAKERHQDERVFWQKIQGKWDSKLLYQLLYCQVFELRKISKSLD